MKNLQLLLAITFLGMAAGTPLPQLNPEEEEGYRFQSPVRVPSEIFSVPTVPPAPSPAPLTSLGQLYSTPQPPAPSPAPLNPEDQLYSVPQLQQQQQQLQQLQPQQQQPQQQLQSQFFQQQQQVADASFRGQNGFSAAVPQTQTQMQGMPYEFEWSVNDIENEVQYSHQQSSDGSVAQGEYRVLLPDGRLQIVTFEDRGQGYQAQVTYEDYNP